MTMTFLGIPVEGDITKGDKRTPQRPLEDLAPLMQAVLDDDGIAAFGWRQCTPYFNDGDPCVFSAYGVWFAPAQNTGTEGTDSQEDDEDEEDTDSFALYCGHLGSYEGGEWVKDPENPPFNKRVGARYVGPDQARYDRCKDLEAAIESGAFDDVLLEAFGDHARVTVKRAGISIEFYEHD